jgi:hypothetical protein
MRKFFIYSLLVGSIYFVWIFIFGPLTLSYHQYPGNTEDLKKDFKSLKLSDARLYFIINDESRSYKNSACYYVDQENTIKYVLEEIMNASPQGGDLLTVENYIVLKAQGRVYKIGFTQINGEIKALQDNYHGYCILKNRISLNKIKQNSNYYLLPLLLI